MHQGTGEIEEDQEHGKVPLQTGRPEGQKIKRYGAILADPAWKFIAWHPSGTGRSAGKHYTVTTLDDMKALPVASIAADDCALFLWVVDSHLVQALELMEAWGFTFKSIAFNWIKVAKTDLSKPRIGLGLWTRKESEICLLGTRGHPKRKSKGVEQVLLEIEPGTILLEPRTKHSRKPTAFHDRIEQLVDGDYVELFSRRHRLGWDSWGNEAGDDHPLLKPLFPPPIELIKA